MGRPKKAGQKLSRREREKLRQRQDILSAALELFSLKGFHNVSVNEIAERSEFAVGTLYKFFKSKEDIYSSILMDSAEDAHRALTETLAQGSDEIDKLRNYVKTGVEIFKKNAPAIRLYLAETRGIGYTLKAGLDEDIHRKFEGVRQKLSAVFESGIRKKIFARIEEPYYLSVALEGMMHGFLFLWIEEPEEHPFPYDADRILSIILKGCLIRNDS